MTQHARRAFLRHAAALSSLGVAAPLGLTLGTMTRAAAQSSGNSGYRALVCIFLYGGNDAFNTVLATDSDSWSHYLNHRDPSARNSADGSTPIALREAGIHPNPAASADSPDRLGGVLPISHAGRSVHTGRSFALHPALKETQNLYQTGHAAVLANVGPLLAPTTKADWANARIAKPSKLFSHNDQQSMWQSFGPEGTQAGWAGRMGDLLMAGNGQGNSDDVHLIRRYFTCMTPTNAAVWLSGHMVMPYQSGSSRVLTLGNGSQIYGNRGVYAAAEAFLSATGRQDMMAQDHEQVVQRALRASGLLAPNLPSGGLGPWGTPTANNYDPNTDDLLRYLSPTTQTRRTNPLAVQLQMVARLIDTNRVAGLGMQRQFFMVGLGGFDTHDSQVRDHAERMAQLDHALKYFHTVLGSMPGGDMRSSVTTFTASEFGRTFTSNGDGTDHGWGGHQLIMGGAVQGGEVYGTFPQYSTANAQRVFGSPDQIDNGSLLPTTSVDQVAYTLGRWMGVSASDMSTYALLPNIGNFNSSTHDLGFMRI
ncbi:DUF1501 domain-containing protein [Aquabacterium fontiphilum]|uniref:DUF1501 domain-containing protein n=1 Tax=Aquabacterium fontiphilum TaxID=450365 RepID=UPI001378BEB0|nr:DUF1501 domain-containing protein [Aquabacterium fontiphilum]NBD20440.1 DUF1501 domain-containing protein [Aquabacterium fontiphilum]